MSDSKPATPRPPSSWKRKEWAVVAFFLLVMALILVFKPRLPEPAPTKERPAVMKEIPAQPGTYPAEKSSGNKAP